MWFKQFPLTLVQKKQLRSRIESFRNDEHLGGVNELAWWAFMLWEGLKGNPVPASSTPRPDFQLQSPTDCFLEVSTLNVSDKDKKKFERGESVSLDHAETIRRVLGKITEEKKRQLMYAAAEKKLCVLALFDYTTWSGFATLFCRTLGEFLLGRQLGFKTFLPSYLRSSTWSERFSPMAGSPSAVTVQRRTATRWRCIICNQRVFRCSIRSGHSSFPPT